MNARSFGFGRFCFYKKRHRAPAGDCLSAGADGARSESPHSDFFFLPAAAGQQRKARAEDQQRGQD